MARRQLLSNLWVTYKDNVKQTEEITLEMFGEDGGSNSKEGTSQTVYIECSGPWESTCPSWISLSPLTGNGGETIVTVSAESAPTTDPRDGEIIIKSQSGLDSIKINVEQEGIQAFIRVIEIDGPYDSKDDSSATYHAGWRESGLVSITFEYPKGTMPSNRNKGELYLDVNTVAIDVDSSSSYDYATYTIQWGACDWVGTFHWEGHIEFYLTDKDGPVSGPSFTYILYQDPKSYISIIETHSRETPFPYDGYVGVPYLEYETNGFSGLNEEYPSEDHSYCAVTVSADTSDAVLFGTSSADCTSTTLTLSKYGGFVYFQVQERDSQAFSDREFKITFTCADYEATGDYANPSGYAEYTITQRGYPFLYLTPEIKSISAEASSFTITINSNYQWSLDENSSWITLSPWFHSGDTRSISSGSGYTQITCIYDENASVAGSRSATITASCTFEGQALSCLTATCVVTQSAATPYIRINGSTNGGASVSNSATSYQITIESNDSWTFNDGAGCTPNAGVGDASSTINFSQNTGADPIDYTITATTTYGATATFTLSQKGALWLIPSYSAGTIVSSADTSDSTQSSITIRVPSGATSVKVSFSSSGNWEKMSYSDIVDWWCSASRTTGISGTVVTYTISENDSIDERTTESAFTYNLSQQSTNDYEYSVIFIQEGQDPYLTIKSGSTIVTSTTISSAMATINLNVDSNCMWAESHTSGVTTVTNGTTGRIGGNISISIPATTTVSTGIVNTYTITVRTNDVNSEIVKYFTVYQKGVTPYVEFVDSSYNVQADVVTSVTVFVTSNTGWELDYDGTAVIGASPLTGTSGTNMPVELTVAQHTATTSTTVNVTATTSDGYDWDTSQVVVGAFVPILTAISNSLIFESKAGGSQQSVRIGGNIAWGLDSKPDWIRVTPESYGTQGSKTETSFSFGTLTTNDSASQRSGVVKFVADNYPSCTLSINVAQNGTGVTTSIKLGSTSVPAKGGNNNIYVTTNGTGGGTLYISAPYASTSTTTPSASVFSGYASAGSYSGNSSTAIRYNFPSNTSVTTYNWYRVYTSDGKGELIFYQLTTELSITVEPEDKSIGWSGGTVYVTITTNDPNGWKVKSMTNRSMIANDISLSTKGNNGVTLEIEVEPSYSPSGTVSGNIVFACQSNTAKTAELTLTQNLTGSGNHWVPTVYLEWANAAISNTTTANTLNYTANTDFSYTCSGGSSFLTSNTVSVGNRVNTTTGSITISGFGANPSASDRKFWVSSPSVSVAGFSTQDMNLSNEQSFTQNRYTPEISISPTSVTISTPQSGKTSAIHVYASNSWTADASDIPDWASLSTTAGTGDATVYISYGDNRNTTPRTPGSITFALNDYPSYTADLTISATTASSVRTVSATTKITMLFTQNETARWDFEFYTDGFYIPANNPLVDFGVYIDDMRGYQAPIGSWYGTSGGGTNIQTTSSLHGDVMTKLGEPISVSGGTRQYWSEYSNGVITITYPEYDIEVTAYPVITPTLTLSTDGTISYSNTAITINVTSNTSWVVTYDSMLYVTDSYCTEVAGTPSPSSITGSGNKSITFTVPQNYSSSIWSSDRKFTFTGTTTYGFADIDYGYGIPEATASTIVEQEGYDNRVTPNITMSSNITLYGGQSSFSIPITVEPSGVSWKLTGEVSSGNGKIMSYEPNTVVSVSATTAIGQVSGSNCKYIFTVTTVESDKYKVATESCTITQGGEVQNHLDYSGTILGADETSTTIDVITANDTVTWKFDDGLVLIDELPLSFAIEPSPQDTTSSNSDLLLGKPSLVTLSPSAGTGTTRGVSVTNITSNSTTITASFTGGSPSAHSITITKYATLSVSTNSSISSGAAKIILTITTVNSGDSWTLSASQTWVTLGQTSGVGGKSVTASISANTLTTARSVTFTLTSNGKSVTCTVTQEAKVTTYQVSINWTAIDDGEYYVLLANLSVTTQDLILSTEIPEPSSFYFTYSVNGSTMSSNIHDGATKVSYNGVEWYEVATYNKDSGTSTWKGWTINSVSCTRLSAGYEFVDDNYPRVVGDTLA